MRKSKSAAGKTAPKAKMRLCVQMLQKGETVKDPTASLDRQFRDCPQVNFVLPFLRRLKLHDNREVEAGFAAVDGARH